MLVALSCALLGGKCGGGDGGGGGGSIDDQESGSRAVRRFRAHSRRASISFRATAARIWVADLLRSLTLIPFDVSVAYRPSIPVLIATFPLPDDSDGNGNADHIPQRSWTISTSLRRNSRFVTASSYEEVLFFSPATGELIEVDISVPASFAKADNPRLPDPGADGEPRTAVSTAVCVKPPPDALDSRGAPFAASLLPARWCDSATPSYRSSFTSGAALAGEHLFVSVSNLGNDQGTPDTQYLPGAVLVYDVDWEVSPRPSARPRQRRC